MRKVEVFEPEVSATRLFRTPPFTLEMTSSLGFQPVPWYEDIRVSVWFIVGMVAFSILVGYYLAGVLDRMGLSRGRKKNSYEMVQHASSQEVEDDSDKEYENTSSVSLPYGDMKMVLVIRTDLDMTKGKVAAQCCHACLAAYRHSQKDKLRIWGSAGQAKITLKCNSEEELLSLHRDAIKNGLVARYIQDAGRTQIDPGTITVLAIGPDYVEKINSVTGHLKLY